MIPVLDAREMRAADAAAIRSGVSADRLMENAAAGMVGVLRERFPGWRRVTVACGPGNNGGDGLAAARLLAGQGLGVAVFTLADADGYRGPAAANARRAREAGLELVPMAGRRGTLAFRRAVEDADGLVDALFGIGLSRPLRGQAAGAVEAINRGGRDVVAADVPSGLSADTGEMRGVCVCARLTVAFAALKRCHVFHPAREACGELRVVPIGIPRGILRRARRLTLVEAADVLRALPRRRGDTHKGDFGRVAIFAGSRGKAGAAVLAARGALRAGAGLVTVFCPASLEETIVSALPEAMTRGLPEEGGAFRDAAAVEALALLEGFDAAAVGPGIGTAPGTRSFLRRLLAARLPLVCDADALNALAGRPGILARRRHATVLTPHPGEAARLLNTSVAAIQADRIGASRRLARRSRSLVVLKGAATLTAAPEGAVRVNPTGSPLMATGGSGDVLTGALAALLAGGLPAVDAASCAVFLHGAAGNALEASLGDAGLLAGELADAFPRARAALHSRGESG